MKHFKINYLENGERRHMIVVSKTQEEAINMFVEETILMKVKFLNVEIIPFEY